MNTVVPTGHPKNKRLADEGAVHHSNDGSNDTAHVPVAQYPKSIAGDARAWSMWTHDITIIFGEWVCGFPPGVETLEVSVRLLGNGGTAACGVGRNALLLQRLEIFLGIRTGNDTGHAESIRDDNLALRAEVAGRAKRASKRPEDDEDEAKADRDGETPVMPMPPQSCVLAPACRIEGGGEDILYRAIRPEDSTTLTEEGHFAPGLYAAQGGILLPWLEIERIVWVLAWNWKFSDVTVLVMKQRTAFSMERSLGVRVF
ncbi:hypothetical protein MKZ38_006756 [Zalerion maritima]|uniref:Uncharacterized protein n=1 Tax=Zalerion maritima TaxID=339359 RepID=A0AAD5WPI4_9PEZI|nr:hypothetical protein MKZ38_006756 [Zalerion maritima]